MELFYHMHLIDGTGRHYVFNLDHEPITLLINTDKFVFDGKANDLHEKFVELYQKLMVERKSLCVITPANCIMLHSDQIVGIQLRYENGL